MVDTGEDVSDQSVSELKLQLNALQQSNAGLNLIIRQKEEVIIKIEAENHNRTECYKNDITKLKEKLRQQTELIENSSVQNLKDSLKNAESKKNEISNELLDAQSNETKLKQVLENYELAVETQTTEYNKLHDLHENVKVNLATLEVAFSDVIQKYERSKGIIEGYKANEKTYQKQIDDCMHNLKTATERYESLKNYAKCQIENANKENVTLKNRADSIEMKQNAIIKRLKIKAAALEVSLEQKTKECADLAALCDEVTEKKC